MKDNRFIELLNLYIDRQITAEETAELEAEIQGDPRRQAVYRQYCQIHSATKLVYESFRAGAEPDAKPASRPATVELFETRRGRKNWVHYVGGVAAAACIGLFLIRYNAATTVAVASPAIAARAPVPVTTVVAAQPAAKTATPAAVTQPRLISLRTTSSSPDYSAMLAALREQDEERSHASERWQAMRAQSLFDDNLFDAKHQVETEARPVQSRTSSQQAEFTAFQFQR